MSTLDPTFRLSARSTVVAYDRTVALRIDTLDLSGTILSVVGHNGAGKSTLIKAMLGLLPISKGSLSLTDCAGRDLVPQYDMAFCPESGAVFADISVREYICLWSSLRHRNRLYFLREGREILDRLEMGPLLKKKGRELSKGQKRRVQTAIGFLLKPRLFLFDEPFDGLDVQRSNELAELIRESSRTMGFVISSHRMDVVERLADTVIVLADGQVFTHGLVSNVCTALAGRSIRIGGISDGANLSNRISAAFPTCVVNHSLGEVVITGAPVTGTAVAELLASVGVRGQIHESQPSLVDALDYHLRELKRKGGMREQKAA